MAQLGQSSTFGVATSSHTVALGTSKPRFPLIAKRVRGEMAPTVSQTPSVSQPHLWAVFVFSSHFPTLHPVSPPVGWRMPHPA